MEIGRMRHKMNEHFPITSGSTFQKAVPQPTLAPAAFNTNQNSTVCLPLMSKNQKIIWIHSNQINIQEDKVAKLDEAFSRFPYLTRMQTISLAQSCSLHPDQVKVWFMSQRLCYGISWDSNDINVVRRKMFGRMTPKRKQQNCENETMKKPKLTREEEGDAEEKQRGRKRKVLKRKNEVLDLNATQSETTEDNSQAFLGSCSKPDITPLQNDGENSFSIKDEALDRSPSVTFQSQVASSVTSLLMEKEQMETNCLHPKKEVSPTCSNLKIKKHGLVCRPLKTKKQLALMKLEFAKYQYPSGKQYRELSSLSGASRFHLVQWFKNMRYLIKKVKPGWLSVEQHKWAVANVVREQSKKMMWRSPQVEKSSSGEVLKWICPQVEKSSSGEVLKWICPQVEKSSSG
ncbi:homeobox and leucine zipper encoding b [Eucyclogobius newberryi]|uniref:homeobox and leucine zipper encoding b n=1 Tax=Eucyclogobius newberryi TaxID=166745 RepID=UPI003B5BD5B1